MDSLKTVQNFLIKQHGLSPENITPDTSFESLGIDSLALTELIFLIEDELNIVIPDTSVDVRTIGDVANVLASLLAEQATSANVDSK